MLNYYLGELCLANAQTVLMDKICPSYRLFGANGGQNLRKHMQMHKKHGKQKKGRENTLT